MIARRHRPLLLPVALVLATAAALACAGVAPAQQSEPPTELWQEYPLDPEPGTQEPAGGGSQGGEQPGTVGTPADDGEGGEGGGAAAVPDGESFPLLPVVVALALLALVLPGLGLWAHGRGGPDSVLPRRVRSRLSSLPVALHGFRDVPAAALSRTVRLRERVGAVRRQSLLDRPWPTPSVRKLRMGFRDQGAQARYPPAMARREQERGLAPEAPREPARAKPPKPQKPKPAAKQRVAEKPPPAKPTQAAKPPQAAKPAKPSRPAKRASPDAQGASAAPKRPVSPPPPKRKRPARKAAPPQAEQAPAREPPQPVEEVAVAEPVLTCSIVWRRAGATSEFTAVSSGLQGHEFVVESSPEFEWLGGAVPAEAREAHAILVYMLIREGWQPVAGEGPWYRQRFERPVGVGEPGRSDG